MNNTGSEGHCLAWVGVIAYSYFSPWGTLYRSMRAASILEEGDQLVDKPQSNSGSEMRRTEVVITQFFRVPSRRVELCTVEHRDVYRLDQ